MKRFVRVVLGLGLAFFLVTATINLSAQSDSASRSAGENPAREFSESFLVQGVTQCSPKRKGVLAPVVLHPVTDVLVAVGDKVKKGQSLVMIDDDEPQADVRLKKANLENAGIAKREAQRYLASLEKLQAQGAIPEQRIHDLRALALKAEADERAAKAAVDQSMAELEHYIVSAPIDGIINRLEVYPGMVSRPGTSVWGEVLDTSEIEVRCQLTLAQADAVVVGDPVEIATDLTKSHGTGKVLYIGMEVINEKIPTLLWLANPDGKLRCGVPVQVRFSRSSKN